MHVDVDSYQSLLPIFMDHCIAYIVQLYSQRLPG